MDYSIMFWGDLERTRDTTRAYEHVLEIIRYADANGYAGIWLPERHFHPWGGMHPNPSVMAAAAAAVTKQIKIRAGSVVLPLQNPLRVAEEWAVVDQLSRGRVELAIATGWKDDDFVLMPQAYESRKDDVWDSVELLRNLWRGKTHEAKNGQGKAIQVTTYPRPVQDELTLWITSAGALRTITNAGGGGFNLLTHLLGQTFDDVAAKVAQYRAYRVRNGFTTPGRIALMLHTYLGTDVASVKETIREPFSGYLLNSADLMIPVDKRAEWARAGDELKAQLAAVAFERYFETASLFGTPESCAPTVKRLAEMGVTDICCLVDFGLDLGAVLEAMPHLTKLKDMTH